MAELKKMTMVELYSKLGYNVHSRSRSYEALDTAAHRFFREYVDYRGHVVSTSMVNTFSARECAFSFTEEEGRGERFWPVNQSGQLIWTDETDQAVVIDVLTHVFRRKAFSDYVGRCKEIRESGQRKPKGGASNQKPRIRKKSNRADHENDEHRNSTAQDGFLRPFKSFHRNKNRTNTDEDGSSDEEEATSTLSILHSTAIKPFQEPPHEPSARFCSGYIRGLNPHRDLDSMAIFEREWLSVKDAIWPVAADRRLLRYMFSNRFFIEYDTGEQLPTSIFTAIKEGTMIEKMEAAEVVIYQSRVKQRIIALTRKLTQPPLLLLACTRESGIVAMTEKFAHMWKHREIYWEDNESTSDDEPPAKKPRKSTAIRAKTPITVPYLQRPTAGNAFGVPTRENDELQTERSVPVGAEITSSVTDPAYGSKFNERVLTTPPLPTRDLSSPAGDLIVVDGRTGTPRYDETSRRKSRAIKGVQQMWGTEFFKQLGALWPNTPGMAMLETLAKVAATDSLEIFLSRIVPIFNERKANRLSNWLTNNDMEVYVQRFSSTIAPRGRSSPWTGTSEEMEGVEVESQRSEYGSLRDATHRPSPMLSLFPSPANEIFGNDDFHNKNLETTAAPADAYGSSAQSFAVTGNFSQDCGRPRRRSGAGKSYAEEEDFDRDNYEMDEIAEKCVDTTDAGRETADARIETADTDAEPSIKMSRSNSPNLYDADAPQALPSSRLGSVHYTPKQIMAKRICQVTGGLNLLIQWEGYPNKADWTWETEAAMMEDIPDLVMAWKERKAGVAEGSFSVDCSSTVRTEEEQRHPGDDTLPEAGDDLIDLEPKDESMLDSQPPSSMNSRRDQYDSTTRPKCSDLNCSSQLVQQSGAATSPAYRGFNNDHHCTVSSVAVQGLPVADTYASFWAGFSPKHQPGEPVHSCEPLNEAVSLAETSRGQEAQAATAACHQISRTPTSVPPLSPSQEISASCYDPTRTKVSSSSPQRTRNDRLQSPEATPCVTTPFNEVQGFRASSCPTSSQIGFDSQHRFAAAPLEAPVQITPPTSGCHESGKSSSGQSSSIAYLRTNASSTTGMSGVSAETAICLDIQPKASQLPSHSQSPTSSTFTKQVAGTSHLVTSSLHPLDIAGSSTNRATPTQLPITPPSEVFVGHRSDRSVPEHTPFSLNKLSSTSLPTNLPGVSLLSPLTPILVLLIQFPDGSMSLEEEDTHPFDVVIHSSLAQFFEFYADVSGTSLTRLASLTFHATFGNSRPFTVRREGGDQVWKRLQRVMPALFKEAVREDRNGVMEWEIMVRGELSHVRS